MVNNLTFEWTKPDLHSLHIHASEGNIYTPIFNSAWFTFTANSRTERLFILLSANVYQSYCELAILLKDAGNNTVLYKPSTIEPLILTSCDNYTLHDKK